MPTNAVMRVPAEEVALAETVQRFDDCHFRVEETAFTDTTLTINVWVTHPDPSAVSDVLEADSSIDDHSLVTEGADEHLFAVELDDGMLMSRDIVHRFDGTVREAYGRDGYWRLEVRFPDREKLSKTVDLFDEYDVDLTIESITQIQDSADPRLNVLTDRQREVLEAAIEEGYYKVPRETTLEELAESVDVSHQALSECLRRAQENLAENELTAEAGPPADTPAE